MTDTTNLDRLDDLVQRLERLGVNPALIADSRATSADGFPLAVATGELIESEWGNAVVNTLNNVSVYNYTLTGQQRINLQIESNVAVATTDATGYFLVPFTMGWPVGPLVVAQVSDIFAGTGIIINMFTSVTPANFQALAINSDGTRYMNQAIRVNYIAIGSRI